MFDKVSRGEITLLQPMEILREARMLIEGLDLENCVIRSNHVSNYINLSGVLGRDKENLLSQLDKVLNSHIELDPKTIVYDKNNPIITMGGFLPLPFQSFMGFLIGIYVYSLIIISASSYDNQWEYIIDNNNEITITKYKAYYLAKYKNRSLIK